MTPFDTYLEATRNPVVDMAKTFALCGFISGLGLTAFYIVAVCIRNEHETRAQRIKRMYNHRFVKNLKRDLL